MNSLGDTPLNQNFVSPMICKELHDLGLSGLTIYQWKVRSRSTDLVTTAFDLDEYYVAASRYLDEVNPPLHVLPAYTIKDIENSLPDWLMTYGPNGYEVSLDKVYGVQSRTSPRMPDAFALLLKQLIIKGLVDLQKINKSLSVSMINS